MSHLYDNAKPRAEKADINRNPFDISKMHHASYGLGKIYPIYARMLQPHETLHISPSMQLDLDSMAHTLKNRLTAFVRWYKVPLRILVSDFKQFYASDPLKPSGYTLPYISRTNPVSVGSLLNHMGVPAVVHSTASQFEAVPLWLPENDLAYNSGKPQRFSAYCNTIYRNLDGAYVTSSTDKALGISCIRPLWLPTTIGVPLKLSGHSFLDLLMLGSVTRQTITSSTSKNSPLLWPVTSPIPHPITKVGSQNQPNFAITRAMTSSSGADIELHFFFGSSWADAVHFHDCSPTKIADVNQTRTVALDSDHPETTIGLVRSTFKIADSDVDVINDYLLQGQVYFMMSRRAKVTSSSAQRNKLLTNCSLSLYGGTSGESKVAYDFTPGLVGNFEILTKLETCTTNNTCFNGNNPALRLSALFPRTYRAIYNGCLRDKVRDPFCPAVNPADPSTSTIPYLDRCVENLAMGADTTTPLDFEYCYWDEDYINGCLPSPTMLTNRPLVGVRVAEDSTSAKLTYSATPSGSAEESGTIELSLSNDGTQKITGITQYQNFDANHVCLESMNEAIKIGISLDDIRSIKAITEWASKNWRSGRFSYRQFVGAHYGCFPDGVDENFPTYLGGSDIKVSEWEVINSSTSNDENAVPLGQRGAMGQFSGSLSDIHVSTDEPCIVMGLMWFKCNNAMVDSLNRTWYVSDRCDFPTPEYAELGTSAVLMREVAPLHATDPTEVWGYNRAYGFMTEEHDTMAGEYCTSRDGEIMVRRLTAKPQLNVEFTTLNPNELTSCFTSGTADDHIYGHIFFDAKLTTWLSQKPNALIM